ncbi:MAG: DUF4118 domain-containing protein [Ilumatobacteraceae bacterium]
MKRDLTESTGLAAGFACITIAVAGAFVAVREELGSANAALILMLVVIGAATVGGRLSGGAAAVTAALSFNFFYTEPYLTLRIHSGRDVLTTGLLLIAGLAVGEVGTARSRQSAARQSNLRSMRALESVGALVTSGASADAVWSSSRDELIASLGVKEATFERGEQRKQLPVIERDGRIDVRHHRFLGDGFALPREGAVIDVEADGAHLGQISLVTNPAVSVTREQRRAAVAIADQFAIALKQENRNA